MSLSAQNLCFSIGQRQILHDIHLDFSGGEFIGLIGPNGSGKSTFLKCLNGINAFTGQVLINGQPLQTFESKALAREISLMNQETSITFPFSCRDVVLMGRYPYSKTALTTPEKDAAAADQYLEKIGIGHLSLQKINAVSGGERQRVLLAKLLAQETGILLLDEPISSLDIKYQEETFGLLKELSQSGKLVVCSVHDLRIALKYCTRLVLLHQGRVLASGSCAEVIRPELIREAFEVEIQTYENPVNGALDFLIKEKR
nr:ABC transporter ATP-binding protein [Eubacterium sp. 1001713B170207_170306_E7]